MEGPDSPSTLMRAACEGAGSPAMSVKCGASFFFSSSGVKSYTSHQRFSPAGSSPASANCAASLC